MMTATMTKPGTSLVPIVTRHDFFSPDTRKGLCFAIVKDDVCEGVTKKMMQVSKSDCCCTAGKAWSLSCVLCPRKGTCKFMFAFVFVSVFAFVSVFVFVFAFVSVFVSVSASAFVSVFVFVSGFGLVFVLVFVFGFVFVFAFVFVSVFVFAFAFVFAFVLVLLFTFVYVSLFLGLCPFLQRLFLYWLFACVISVRVRLLLLCVYSVSVLGKMNLCSAILVGSANVY